MRSALSCSSCILLLFLSLLGHDESVAAAREALEPRWETGHGEEVERRWLAEEDIAHLVHQIPKAAPQVTPPPGFPFARPARRDANGVCPADHSLCPADLGGGCCPSQYECATDSCYATTAGPTSACNKSGHYFCTNGEVGCCPVGFLCAREDCILPMGVTYSDIQCPNNYYLCPSSMNFGCCQNGMGCAPTACYSTEPVTRTVTQVITTTTANGATITETRTAVTVSTPTPPTGLPQNNDHVAKFIPTSVPKVPAATQNSGNSGGGLSAGAIAGIIAGAVALLLVVIVATFIIIRRLKKVENIIESKRGSSSGDRNGPRSQRPAQMAEMTEESVDPLMVGRSRADTATTAQPNGLMPGPTGQRAYSDAGAYQGTTASPSPNMVYDHSRQTSLDSHPAGWFSPDSVGVMQPAHVRGGSVDSGNSQYPYYIQQQQGYTGHHWRQQSNASELSAEGSEGGRSGNIAPFTYGHKPRSPSGGGATIGLTPSPGPAELDGSIYHPSELPDPSTIGVVNTSGRGYSFGNRNGQHPGGYFALTHQHHSRSSSVASAVGGGGHVRQGSDGVGYVVGGGGGVAGYVPVPEGDPEPEPGVSGQMSPNWGPAVSSPPLHPHPQPPGPISPQPPLPQQEQQQGQPSGLSPLDEAPEIGVHGFYGRPDQQTGQTAAGLEREARRD